MTPRYQFPKISLLAGRPLSRAGQSGEVEGSFGYTL
jgi:hypothetical protein